VPQWFGLCPPGDNSQVPAVHYLATCPKQCKFLTVCWSCLGRPLVDLILICFQNIPILTLMHMALQPTHSPHSSQTCLVEVAFGLLIVVHGSHPTLRLWQPSQPACQSQPTQSSTLLGIIFLQEMASSSVLVKHHPAEGCSDWGHGPKAFGNRRHHLYEGSQFECDSI